MKKHPFGQIVDPVRSRQQPSTATQSRSDRVGSALFTAPHALHSWFPDPCCSPKHFRPNCPVMHSGVLFRIMHFGTLHRESNRSPVGTSPTSIPRPLAPGSCWRLRRGSRPWSCRLGFGSGGCWLGSGHCRTDIRLRIIPLERGNDRNRCRFLSRFAERSHACRIER